MSFRNIFARFASTAAKEGKKPLEKLIKEWSHTVEQLPQHPLVEEMNLSKTLLSNSVPDSARKSKTLIQGLTEKEEAAIPRRVV